MPKSRLKTAFPFFAAWTRIYIVFILYNNTMSAQIAHFTCICYWIWIAVFSNILSYVLSTKKLYAVELQGL